MKIDSVKVGHIGTNCYLLCNEENNKGALVDCGDRPDKIDKMVSNNAVEVEYIILTHGHFDHIMAVSECALKYNAKIIMHRDDVEWIDILKSGQYRQRYSASFKPFKPDILIEGDCKMDICGLELEFICTPGHTRGGMCIKCEDVILSGDTVFYEEIGRCDLYGGDYEKMLNSLRKLSKIEGEYKVLPGHGEATELKHELMHNQYFKEALKA